MTPHPALAIYRRIFDDDPTEGTDRGFAIIEEMRQIRAAATNEDACVVVRWWWMEETRECRATVRRARTALRRSRACAAIWGDLHDTPARHTCEP